MQAGTNGAGKKCEFESLVNGETSSRSFIQSGEPLGSILGPLLYILFPSCIPTTNLTTIGTFAGDTAIFLINEDSTVALIDLQEHLSLIGE